MVQRQRCILKLVRGRRLWVWIWLTITILVWVVCNPHLLPSFLLSYYCMYECMEMAMVSPPSPESPVVVNYLVESVLAHPQSQPPLPPTFAEIDDPPWREMGQMAAWSAVETVIRIIFQHKKRGTFVEAGAGNGIFKSHTVWLEERLGWHGLLVEPLTHAYQQLRQSRKATTAHACVSDQGHNKKTQLWTPNDADLLPDLYRDLAFSRSTLVEYVVPEDISEGYLTDVQCYTLNALVWAWIGRRRHLDLLVLDTAGGEHRIFDFIEGINISVAIVHHHTPIDKSFLKASAKLMDMEYMPGLVPHNTFYLFFMNHNFAEYVRSINLARYPTE